MRKRKGNMALVIFFGATLTSIMVGFMHIAADLYTNSKESATMYADYQSYRSAMEISSYQFVKDLCSVTVTKDMDGEWIGVDGNALYVMALEDILEKVSSVDDTNLWQVRDMNTCLSGVEMSEPRILNHLQEKVEHSSSEFWIKLPSYLRLDWSDSGSWSDRNGSYVAIEEFEVDVHFGIRTENLNTTLAISNLYFDLTPLEMAVGDDVHEFITFSIVEGEGGVRIERRSI